MDLSKLLFSLKLPGTVLLCLPFVASGAEKCLNFRSAIGEVKALGLPGPQLVAKVVIALQLIAPAMILTGVLVWVAALALAAFTTLATWMRHGWWREPSAQQADTRRAFFEHCAIVGGLLLLAHANSGKISPFAPLKHRAFALLWTATLISNIGTWMHDVSAAWLMTSLSPSPFVVALVQAATSGAMALFALPAGAMADLFDRKRLLLTLVAIKTAFAVLLGGLTLLGFVSAWSLLIITFMLGVASALMAPVWQSIVPTLVPRQDLKPAVALNSLGINIARAIGPTLGGVLIVSMGVASSFLLNAASELAIIAALLLWQPLASVPPKRPEQFVPAMIAGARFAMHSTALKSVLWRSAGFFLFASAFWALIPLVARQTLGGDASLYGMIVGAVGVGAVLGAIVLPMVDARLGSDRTVQVGSVITALVLVLLGFVPSQHAAIAAGALAGIAWIWVLSTLNVAAQNALPDWVRGRGLSIYGLVFFGAMTVGSLGWGALATWTGLPVTLAVAAAGLVLAIPLTRSYQVSVSPGDLTPSGHWPEPVIAADIEGDRGPVMVSIEYCVAPDKQVEFSRAVNRLADERRRDGAYQWGLMQDAAKPERFIEYFHIESWIEHERQHARVTRADADLQAEIAKLTKPETPPKVTHWLAEISLG